MSAYIFSGFVLGVMALIILFLAKAKAPKQYPEAVNALHAKVSDLIRDDFGPLGFHPDLSMKIHDDIHKVFGRGEQRIRVLYDAREKRFALSYSPGNILKEYETYSKVNGTIQTVKEYHNQPDWNIMVENHIGNELSEAATQEIYSECRSKIEALKDDLRRETGTRANQAST